MFRDCRWLGVIVIVVVATLSGCGHDEQRSAGEGGATRVSNSNRPNLLFIVWDTVRADHLSLYGHERETTPYLEEWSQQARVFEDCVVVGSTTKPSHLSMFTGLLPLQHRVHNKVRHIQDDYEMLAELLKDEGYATYCFSENPHISARWNFTQGFDETDHPWSPEFSEDALRLALEKVAPEDREPELVRRLRARQNHQIKWVGELAQVAVEKWLAQKDAEQPYFVFLNYMEAHHPLVPPRVYRERMMSPEMVEASYEVPRTNKHIYGYNFGYFEYTPEQIELIRGTYDAALLELDTLFKNLIASLESSGHLENTIVVLVGDHGENLGEHHLMDHFFSVHEPIMHVPMVLHYPPKVPAGRESRPVTNMDLFPTLVGLLGLEMPVASEAVSLLSPPAERRRVGDWQKMPTAIPRSYLMRPDFDRSRWIRDMQAYYVAPYKLIASSDGKHELYNLDEDPEELENLIDDKAAVAQRMLSELEAYIESLPMHVNDDTPGRAQPVDPATLRRLRGLGYLGGEEPEPAEGAESP